MLADCLFIRSVSTAVFHVPMRLSHRWLTMALIVAVLGLASPVAHAQTNQWTWMGGSSTFTSSDNEVVGQGGVYGSGPCCAPGGRSGAAHWTDANGNLWLFGGQGFDGNGTFGYLNDLWTYNPTYNEWTFISGSITVPQFNGGQPGNSTSFFNSTPGGRSGAMSWTDANGNLWLFGGAGFDVAGNGGNLNDLWEFNINQYRWVLQGGTSTLGSAGSVAGTYGELQSFDAGSYPGSRNFGTTWTDGSGNFWLFGGYGQDSLGQSGYLNDLWEYNTANGQWAWMAGSSTIPGDFQGQSGNYGQLGAMVDSNVPGGRAESAGWKDSSGNLWLFGGNGFQPTSNGSSTSGYLNDLWEYNTSSNEWTWMGGSNFFTSNCDSLYGAVCGHAGIYGSLLQGATANIPGGRSGAALWTDASGNFWLFGGMGQDSIGATTEPLNDLWEFNPTANEWTWVSGSSTAGTDGQAGVYGSLNMAASSNAPGGREDAVGGLDQSGNFWMMGGYGLDSAGKSGYLNDLWRYQPPAQATAPIFSQSGGSYTASLSISISDTTPGAAIHYTTDGSTPSATSPVFSTAIPITATETINAIAVANGYIDSPVITETYTILQQQTVTFAPITGTQAVQTTINLSATASSGLPVTFSSSTPTVCTVSGSTASLLTSGQCGLIATQAGNNVYGQASASQNFIVHQVSQTITFSPVSSQIVGAQVTLSATATSGMPVTFSSNSPSVCTVSGNTATMMSTGNCIILGTQSGNLAYLAVSAQQVFSVTLLQQTITFQPITGTQLALTSVSLSASASSGLPVAFTSTTPTICTVSGAMASLLTSGQCAIVASQPGNSTYSAAPSVSQHFAVHQTTQTITFAAIPNQLLGTQLTLSATTSSGLTVTFNSTTPSTCTVSGTTATMITGGNCGIQARQAGNAIYLAAPTISDNFKVTLPSQTITFQPITGTQVALTSVTLTATASSGLPVTFTSSTPSICTVSGNTASLLASGLCAIVASQPGSNTTYAPAPSVTQKFTVHQATQTITFPAISSQIAGAQVTLSATASSGLAVTYTSTTTSVCTVSGTTATMVAAGKCTIQASQAGNGAYLAAAKVSQSFTVTTAAP